MLERKTLFLSVSSYLCYFLALSFIYAVKALITMYTLLHHCKLKAYLIICSLYLSSCTALLLPDASAWSWHNSTAVAPLDPRPVWFILMIYSYSCFLHQDHLHLWLMSYCCEWSHENTPMTCTSQGWFMSKTHLLLLWTITNGYCSLQELLLQQQRLPCAHPRTLIHNIFIVNILFDFTILQLF